VKGSECLKTQENLQKNVERMSKPEHKNKKTYHFVQKLCFFFNAKVGCRNGSPCPFVNDRSQKDVCPYGNKCRKKNCKLKHRQSCQKEDSKLKQSQELISKLRDRLKFYQLRVKDLQNEIIELNLRSELIDEKHQYLLKNFVLTKKKKDFSKKRQKDANSIAILICKSVYSVGLKSCSLSTSKKAPSIVTERPRNTKRSCVKSPTCAPTKRDKEHILIERNQPSSKFHSFLSEAHGVLSELRRTPQNMGIF